jgi:protein SCO1/2
VKALLQRALATPARQRLAILAALLLTGAASWWLLPAPASLQDVPLEVSQLEDLQVLPDFRLAREEGELTRAEIAPHWHFLFFGYTNCPNACPTTLALVAHVQNTLRERGLVAPQAIFISIDPKRDTPALAQRYAAAFGAGVTGAVADPAGSTELMRFLGVSAHANEDGKGAEGYTVDHTTNFYLIAPGARWRATFAPAADDAEAVLADTTRLLELPRH